MSSRLHFFTGIVMLVLAATLAFTISRRASVASDPAPTAGRAPAAPAGIPVSQRIDPSESGAVAPREVLPDREITASSQQAVAPIDFTVTVDPALPDRRELLERAERVELHARTRLQALNQALELTPEQQRRIFPILVRSSDSYDPAMTTATGSHAATRATADPAPLPDGESESLIQRELDPVQQDQLVESSITDLMLWEEIIGNLVQQLDQSPADPGLAEAVSDAPPRAIIAPPAEAPAELPPAPSDVPAPPPPSRGGRNLFENVPPSD